MPKTEPHAEPPGSRALATERVDGARERPRRALTGEVEEIARDVGGLLEAASRFGVRPRRVERWRRRLESGAYTTGELRRAARHLHRWVRRRWEGEED